MNYIGLVRELSKLTGVTAGAPASVVGTSGEAARYVEWIKRANHQIQSRWANWKFHWRQISLVADPAQQYIEVAELPDDMASVDSARIGGRVLAIDEYETSHINPDSSATGTPTTLTRMPDGRLRLFPIPQAAETLVIDYYRTPQTLAANDDVPLLPERFHDVIVYWALGEYALYESAPEMLEQARTYLAERLPKLEAACLPGGNDRHITNLSELTVTPA